MSSLSDPFTLPCGAVLKNRIAKAPMTEGLGDGENRATDKHVTLYRRWAEGGTGLLITGNVQMDRNHLDRGGNVVIDGPQDAEARARLKAWAGAGTANDTHLWMQLSHAGRQTAKPINPQPVAPSAVAANVPGMFGDPREIREEEILALIEKFASAAVIARDTGFTGVQVHSAHGYLLSEFLSPDVNLRTDAWGGSLENRARLLLEIIRAVRKGVGSDFPISVKLNSADFQKGGFSHEEAMQVASWLNDETVDLLEVSGGTFEAPAMMGKEEEMRADPKRAEKRRASTIAREAYFLEYAQDIRKVTTIPLAVTGGFRTKAAMEAALGSGACDIIGIGRPFCTMPDLTNRLLNDGLEVLPKFEETLRIGPGFLGPQSSITLFRMLNLGGTMGWFYEAIREMADGNDPNLKLGVFRALISNQLKENKAIKALKR